MSKVIHHRNGDRHRKTYVTALLIKTLRQHGDIGYFGGYQRRPDSRGQRYRLCKRLRRESVKRRTCSCLISDHAVSPHLATRWEHKPIEKTSSSGISGASQRLPVCHSQESGSDAHHHPLRDDDQAFFN